jgi:hypothetical protein
MMNSMSGLTKWHLRINKYTVAIVLCVGSIITSDVQAQSAGFVGIEGQITDRATGRPVAGARVIFRQSQASDGFAISDSTVITDDSGFYQFELQPIPNLIPSIVVWCQTPKGDTTLTLPLYVTLRNESVYVRNAAIALPKRQTRCIPF